MDLPHFLTSGMGGIRSAGDLVARMQFSKNMRVKDAKEYVAKKLGLDTVEIADEFIMRDLREELGIGVVTGVPRSNPRNRRQDEHREPSRYQDQQLREVPREDQALIAAFRNSSSI